MLHLWKRDCGQEGVFPLGSALLALNRRGYSGVSSNEDEIFLASPRPEGRAREKIGVKLRGASFWVVSTAWGRALIAWTVFS